MARLFGRNFTKRELLERCGDMDQFAGATKAVLADGDEAGVEAIFCRTGSGLNYTVLPGRGLDISAAEFKGASLCWRSTTGDKHAAYFEPEGFSWLRQFYGGLVCTCGMAYAGAPVRDDPGKLPTEENIGLHGRVSNIPARNVCLQDGWDGDDYWFSISGKIRETGLYLPNLELRRRITSKLGENRLWINDEVENIGFLPQEHMFLLHINIGYPVVSEDCEVVSAVSTVTGRDPCCVELIDSYNRFQPPTPGMDEHCYYHDLKAEADGTTYVAIINRAFNQGHGLGIELKFNLNEYDQFTEWKMCAQGTYVIGLEPANCRVTGRDRDRREGRLKVLQPGEVRKYDMEISVLDGQAEIDECVARISALGT
ncbi:MAG: aldose 1-epimerase family protein [Candidatus Zipacnadales bacterium]